MIGMLLRVCALFAADYQTFACSARPGSHYLGERAFVEVPLREKLSAPTWYVTLFDDT
jgi:hypothetical protein